MAGLGGRMSTVIKAKVSKLLDRAEDPGETLDYGYQKQVELLQNVKKGIADVVTSKKRLQMQSTKLEQQVVKLDTQARQAVSQGREFRLADREAAVVFNRTLPCKADVTDVDGEGDSLLAAFRLREGPGGSCDGSARVRFRFRNGKFTEWRQLPEAEAPPGGVL